jgi:hypothetical protein
MKNEMEKKRRESTLGEEREGGKVTLIHSLAVF